MNCTAFEDTVAKDMALIRWVLRCVGKIGSCVSTSQLMDKTGSTVRKREWIDQDRAQMEISGACWYSHKQSQHYVRKKILAKHTARKGLTIKVIAVGRAEKKRLLERPKIRRKYTVMNRKEICLD
jgi:hypothetical protein